MANKATLLAAAAAAAMLAGSTFAANAQVLRDDPPGAAFQDRATIESDGQTVEEAYGSPRQAYGYVPSYRRHSSIAAPRRAFRNDYRTR